MWYVGNSLSRGKNIIINPGCSGNSIICFDWCVGMCSGVMIDKARDKEPSNLSFEAVFFFLNDV